MAEQEGGSTQKPEAKPPKEGQQKPSLPERPKGRTVNDAQPIKPR